MAEYICIIDGKKFTVDATSNFKAKQEVAHKYRKKTGNNYPIAFLIENISCTLKDPKPAGRPRLERPENFGKE